MSAKKGNKYALGNNGGRPPLYNSPEELEEKINEYFDSRIPTYDDEGNVLAWNFPSVTGLALFLGFSSRQGLYDYRNNKEYSCIIKRALMVVESHYEEKCNFQGATGSIFVLKNMGWKDQHDVNSTNTNLNTDLSEEERKEALKRVKSGLDEFKDYE